MLSSKQRRAVHPVMVWSSSEAHVETLSATPREYTHVRNLFHERETFPHLPASNSRRARAMLSLQTRLGFPCLFKDQQGFMSDLAAFLPRLLWKMLVRETLDTRTHRNVVPSEAYHELMLARTIKCYWRSYRIPGSRLESSTSKRSGILIPHRT